MDVGEGLGGEAVVEVSGGAGDEGLEEGGGGGIEDRSV